MERELRTRLVRATSVLVVTGAGVSVASGLPTYRGEENSLYSDPEALLHAFGSELRRDPVAFWAAWRPRRAVLRAARPNPAHAAIAKLERDGRRFLLATQNVDDLHRRAGSRAIAELQGNAFRERCLDDACGEPPWVSSVPTDDDPAAPIAKCPRCQALARPDVVLFGEGDDERLEAVRSFVRAGVGLVLLVGTSGVVQTPQAILAEARRYGDPYVVEIAPKASPELDEHVSATWIARAEDALPTLVAGG